jgi:spore coat polysaccharide biosynthesis protein SpsF
VTRRLVAVLPCRCNSTRLWGKPLQPIAAGIGICEYLALTLARVQCVSEVRLAIAAGPGQEALVGLAERVGLPYLVGSEEDVLGRVIACAHEAGATDVLRKTSEDPFLHVAMLEAAWNSHVEHGNDVTALDLVPEGTGFEIFTAAALVRCHERGDAQDREHIANYARFHQSEFAVEILHPEPVCQRLDLRLTVDNPEDLILCRAVCRALAHDRSPIALCEIVSFLDDRPDLTELVRAFVEGSPVWLGVAQRERCV